MITTIADGIRRWLPSGRLARGVAVLAGGNALAQLIGIVVAPILTRLYSPTDYGLVTVYSSLLGLLTIVVSGRYELAILLPKKDRSALDVVLLTLTIVLTMSAVYAGGLWYFGDWLLELMQSKPLRPYLWLLPIAVVGGGTYQTFNYWATRRKTYRRLAQTRFNQSISSAAVSVGVGAVHQGPLGLLLASIIAQTAGISMLVGDAWRTARGMGYRLSLPRLRHAAYAYRQFPVYSCAAALFNSAGLTLPSLLLSSFYGSEVTGWFGLAQRIVLLPMGLVGQAVSQVFLGEAAQILHDTPAQLPVLFNRVTFRLLPLCLLVIVIGLCAPVVFGFVFGERFATAGVYTAFLAISCSAQLIASPISMVAVLMKRQDIQLVLDIVRVVAVAAALCLPPLAGASATLTVAAYSIVMALLYLMYYIVYRQLARSLAMTRTLF